MAISMDRWKRKVAIVTGASTGIGAAIAERLVEEGLMVVGLARRKEKIEELAKKLEDKSGKLFAVRTDITKVNEVIDAFEWIQNNVGPVHVLVNNAGISRSTTLMDGDIRMWTEVFDTNVMGLCVATREAVRIMRANNIDGHIVHINSMAGRYVPMLPESNVYPASKHAVLALTETLRQELLSVNSKIKITCINPGLVDTEIFEATFLGSGRKYSEEIKRNFLEKNPSMQPVDVANAVIFVLATPSHVQIQEMAIRPVGEKL